MSVNLNPQTIGWASAVQTKQSEMPVLETREEQELKAPIDLAGALWGLLHFESTISMDNVQYALLSKEEAKYFKGKMKSLRILQSYPRANIPIHRTALLVLESFFVMCEDAEGMPFTEEDYYKLEKTKINMKFLENVIIKAIVSGGNFDDLVRENFKVIRVDGQPDIFLGPIPALLKSSNLGWSYVNQTEQSEDTESVIFKEYSKALWGMLTFKPLSPAGNVQRPLLSKKEAKYYKEQLKSLRILKSHPRANIPVHHVALCVLKSFFERCRGAAKMEFNEEDSSKLEETKFNMKIIENVIIKAIIDGGNFYQLLESSTTAEKIVGEEKVKKEDDTNEQGTRDKENN